MAFQVVLKQKPRLDPQATTEPGPPPRVDPARRRADESPVKAAAETERPAAAPCEPSDPLVRALALPVGRAVEPSAPAPRQGASPLPDDLALDRLVKRLSWGGNGKRGSARIELGAGALAGATLLVHAEGTEVTIEVEGGDPSAVEALAQRVGHRLDRKGLCLRDVRQG